MKKRLGECEGFVAFISYMRIQIGCFLRPVKDLCEGFSSEPLSKCGFLAALGTHSDIYEAYKLSEPSLSLSKEEKGVLATLFSSIGSGYLTESINIIDSSLVKMESLEKHLRTELVKNVKLVAALSVTAALGIVILGV